jgi:DNA primase
MSGIDYRLLRAAVSMEQVLRLLQYRPTCRHGEQLRGPCPIHDPQLLGDGRCFSVHLGRHVFRCFHCGAGGNQLDLWKLAQGLPLHAAALELCRQLNLPPPPKQQPRTDGKLKSRNSEPPPPRSATADLALPSPPEWPRF